MGKLKSRFRLLKGNKGLLAHGRKCLYAQYGYGPTLMHQHLQALRLLQLRDISRRGYGHGVALGIKAQQSF